MKKNELVSIYSFTSQVLAYKITSFSGAHETPPEFPSNPTFFPKLPPPNKMFIMHPNSN